FPECFPIYPLDIEADNLVSRCRHLFHFHFAVGANKQHDGIRCLPLQCVGNSDGREDMSSCSTSAYNDPFCRFHLLSDLYILTYCGNFAHNDFLTLFFGFSYSVNLIDITAYAENNTERQTGKQDGRPAHTDKGKWYPRYRAQPYCYGHI